MPKSFPQSQAWLLATLLGLLSACASPIGVRHVGAVRMHEEFATSALTGDGTSLATLQTLLALGLVESYDDDPDAALQDLHRLALEERDRTMLFALAELHHVRALDTGDLSHDAAAALFAYWYLFAADQTTPPDPYDRRFRMACDLYNLSLVRVLTGAGEESVQLASASYPLPGAALDVRFDGSRFPFPPDVITNFLAADELDVRGIDVRNRDNGLGAPLIGTGENVETGNRFRRFQTATLSVPATAFLRVTDPPAAWTTGTLHATLELYPAYEVPSVTVDGATVPLETDLTAPLASRLEGAPVWDTEIAGFRMNAGAVQPGLFMIEPYQPGRIPVVLVHGTASSPARWAPMLNGLLADHVLRARCQFWYFTYNTGNPIAYSGSLLRAALADVVQAVDPSGSDPALSQIVLIGHSQGGLLARMAVTTTGDALWDAVYHAPFDELDLTEESRTLLRQSLFWERVSNVDCVIFLATPHRGSYLTTGLIGWISSKLVTLPKNITDSVQDVFSRNSARLPPELRGRIPTAVSGMEPDSPFLVGFDRIPIAPGVEAHSIIAVDEDDVPLEEGVDGVVAYSSAHLEGTASEFVVHSGHSCQANPLVIREVRRILRARVAAADTGSTGEAR